MTKRPRLRCSCLREPSSFTSTVKIVRSSFITGNSYELRATYVVNRAGVNVNINFIYIASARNFVVQII